MGLVNACADNGLEIAVSGTRYNPTKVDDWLPLVLQGVMAEAEARRIRKRNMDSVETNALRGTPTAAFHTASGGATTLALAF